MLKLKLFTAIFISLFIFSASEVIQVQVFDHNEVYLFSQEYEIESLAKYQVSAELAFEEDLLTIRAAEQPKINIDVTKEEETKSSSRRRRSSRSSKDANIDIDLTKTANGTDIDIDLTKTANGTDSNIDLTEVANGTSIDIDLTEVNKTMLDIDIDVTKEEEIKPSRRRRSSRSGNETTIDIDLTKTAANGTDIDIDMTKTVDNSTTIGSQNKTKESEEKRSRRRARGEIAAQAMDINIDLEKAEDQKDSITVKIDESLKQEGDVIPDAALDIAADVIDVEEVEVDDEDGAY